MITLLIIGTVLLLFSLISALGAVGSFFGCLAYQDPKKYNAAGYTKFCAFTGALGIVILIFDLGLFICSKL